MAKKIFLLCLAMLFVVTNAAAAKDKGLPEEERVKIFVEVTDDTRHPEFGTAQNLETFLNEKIVEKNFVSVVEKKLEDGLILDEDRPATQKVSAENIGELLVFNAIELPTSSATPENFNQDFYQNLGAAYVVRCEVLALGLTKVEDKAFGIVTNVLGAGFTLSGQGSSNRDKTLRRIGTSFGALTYLGMADFTKRTALNTVVNMKFISVESGQILWEENFTGQAVKHRKPDKNFDDVWEQAYIESVEDAAKKISKRVNKYVDKVLIKGKSDKNFRPKKSAGSLVTGKIF